MAKKSLEKELYSKALDQEKEFRAEEKKKNAKPKEEATDEEMIALSQKHDRLWEAARSSRKEWDWKWFIYDLFVTGNHYAKWDNNTQQIITTPKDSGKPKVVINKVYTTLRAVRNYVLRNRPRAETTPYNLSPENVDDAVKLNKFLDALHDKLGLREKLKASLWHALKYSIGWWQVLWDEDAEYGSDKGDICVYEIDPYDLYWDPIARTPKEARYCILAVRRSIQDLKDDPKYNKGDFHENLERVKGDKQLSASTMKSRLMAAERGAELSSDKDDQTVIVKELWIKEDGKIRIVTKAGDQLIRNELTDLKRLPFFRLRGDTEPLSMIGQGWVKNLIDPQKLLNRLESQVAEWNDIMNKGKWVSDKGAGVRIINNENGQIIEKKRGFDVHQEQIASLSPVIFEQISNVNRYIEDIGGAHDASMGRIPAGAQSGKALEALQVGDSNNMSEVVENVEEFLEEVYEYILYLASQKYQFARNLILVSSSERREFLKFIGEGAAQRPDGAVIIPEKNMVDVKISSWLANTAEARREILKELYQLQVIDQQTLLDGYNIGAVADILERTRKEKEQTAIDNIKTKVVENQMMTPASTPGGAQQAIANIRQVLNGEPLSVPPQGVGPEYVDYLDNFINSGQGQKLMASNPEEFKMIQALKNQAVAHSNQAVSQVN